MPGGRIGQSFESKNERDEQTVELGANRLRRKLIPENNRPQSTKPRDPAGHFSKITFVGPAIKFLKPAFFIVDDDRIHREDPYQDKKSEPQKPSQKPRARADGR